MSARWTRPRIQGLRAFGRVGLARESNVTDVLGETVYWQTARWLEREGFIAPHFVLSRPGTWFELTPAGWAALEKLADWPDVEQMALFS